MNLNKIMEKLICRLIIADMKESMDPSQFANQPGVSVQHYLIKMLDRILSAMDDNVKGESVAVVASLIDWAKAFPRLDATLGIKSFIDNGVRPSLIPIITSFFEKRRMRVKWHGQLSSVRNLPGGGPMGSTFGIIGYLSQSNDNANCVPEEDRYKYMDDLTMLEIVSLSNIGIATHNLKQNIPSNIPLHNQIVPNHHLKSQYYLNNIAEWTKNKQMVLNERKSKSMIFNFSKRHQFTTNLKLKGETLEVLNEAKLLGTIISTDLKWDKNTEKIVKHANSRMKMLHVGAKFISNNQDLVYLYKTFIRSVLEFSSVVWHSSLSKSNISDIERIQKSAVKVILKDRYVNYKKALSDLNLEPLSKRREKLCLKFAKKSLKLQNFKQMFPLSKKLHCMKQRKGRKYVQNYANTERYRKSSIPYMQRLLNEEDNMIKSISYASELCQDPDSITIENLNYL